MKKEFTAKQVYILVLVIVAVIAFLETSGAVWSGEFWRGFILNVFIYGLVAEIIAGLVGEFLNRRKGN